jgi:hypothetical protein
LNNDFHDTLPASSLQGWLDRIEPEKQEIIMVMQLWGKGNQHRWTALFSEEGYTLRRQMVMTFVLIPP